MTEVRDATQHRLIEDTFRGHAQIAEDPQYSRRGHNPERRWLSDLRSYHLGDGRPEPFQLALTRRIAERQNRKRDDGRPDTGCRHRRFRVVSQEITANDPRYHDGDDRERNGATVATPEGPLFSCDSFGGQVGKNFVDGLIAGGGAAFQTTTDDAGNRCGDLWSSR